MFTRILCAAALAAMLQTAVAAHDTAANAKITVVFDQAIPNVPGKSMRGVLVEYGPGGFSPAHTHPETAFIYATVLSGAIRSKVNDAPEKVYRAGQNFAERPGDHHGVSANASETEPASLLAVFVVDTTEQNLVTNDPK